MSTLTADKAEAAMQEAISQQEAQISADAAEASAKSAVAAAKAEANVIKNKAADKFSAIADSVKHKLAEALDEGAEAAKNFAHKLNS